MEFIKRIGWNTHQSSWGGGCSEMWPVSFLHRLLSVAQGFCPLMPFTATVVLHSKGMCLCLCVPWCLSSVYRICHSDFCWQIVFFFLWSIVDSLHTDVWMNGDDQIWSNEYWKLFLDMYERRWSFCGKIREGCLSGSVRRVSWKTFFLSGQETSCLGVKKMPYSRSTGWGKSSPSTTVF